LHRRRPEGSARTVIEGEVGELRALGGRVRVLVHGRPDVLAEVTAAAAAELDLAAGGPVFASLKATEVRIVDV
jgi:molybdate transport system permease protein